MDTSVVADIEAAARFGGEGTGVTRLAWSQELRDVQAWLTGQLEALGREVELDAAGNLIGRWQAGTGPAVVVGSHLDTVPRAGRYDGALGVVSGLQAIRPRPGRPRLRGRAGVVERPEGDPPAARARHRAAAATLAGLVHGRGGGPL